MLTSSGSWSPLSAKKVIQQILPSRTLLLKALIKSGAEKYEDKEDECKGDKGFNLYYQCWLPSNEPSAILLSVHSQASATTGAYFLDLLESRIPFPVKVFKIDTLPAKAWRAG